MKKFLVTIALMINTIFIFAQTSDIESEIRKLEEESVRAVLEKDTVKLKQIWDPSFIVNAPVSRVVVGGQIDLIKNGIINYSSFDSEIEHIRIMGDFVITMGNETVVPTGNNPMSGTTIKRRYTQIWMKQNGSWILIARHANNVCQ